MEALHRAHARASAAETQALLTAEREAAAEALRTKEADLREAQRQARIGSWHWDARTDITTGSDELLRIFGFDPATQNMPNFKEQRGRCYPEEDWERVNAAVQQTVETGEGYELDVRVLRGGAMRWATTRGGAVRDAQGRIVGLRGTVQDITERKQAEEALRRSESRWNAAIENLGEGAIIATEAGQVIYWNPAARIMHGFASETEGIGPLTETPSTFQLWTPDGRRLLALEEWPMPRIMRGESVRHVELRLRRPDQGWERIVSYSGAMVETGSGERLVYLSVYDLTEQRKAEAALRDSEHRLRTLGDQIPGGAVYQHVQRPDGRVDYAYMSAGVKRLCGLPAERVMADPDAFRQLIVEEDRPRVAVAEEQSARELTPFDCEFRQRTATGEVKWVQCRSMPRRLDDGSLLWDGIVVDITVSKRAEEALRKSEEEFRTLTEAMPQIVWATRPDGWNIYFNHKWVDYTGLTLDESYGHGWITPFHPDDKQRAWDAWQRATQHNDTYLLECRLRCADGVYRWWLIHGAPMRSANGEIQKWFGTCTDIEERKQAEETLREGEQRFRTMAESIPQLAWMAQPDGHIFWYNRRWYEYTGTTLEQMEGWGWQTVHDPDELPRVLERWKTAIAEGKPWEDTFPLRRHDGTMRPHLSRAVPIYDPEGHVSRWFGTNTDISERIEMEESLQRAKEAAEAANVAKGQFLANMSHELRTPMNAILGMIDVALPKAIDPTVQDCLQTARGSADLLLTLLNDLLDSAKIESGKLELESAPFSLRRMLNQITRVLAVRASERGLAFYCRVPDETPDAGRW